MVAFSRILPIAATAYGFQAAAGLVFVPLGTEKYFDFCGSLGFLSTAFVSLYYPFLKDRYWHGVSAVNLPPLSALASRQILLNAALGAWAVRLGSFLFWRALKSGGDTRFDDIKKNPSRFAFSWIAQATWVFAVGLPVYLVNTVPAHAVPAMRIRDYASLALFAGSWAFELMADYQKTKWRQAKNNKQHGEKFINSGLWSLSRHPNYVGEVGLWTGIWALSVPALSTPYVPQYSWLVAGLSPLLTWALTRYVSGVPPLEAQNDKKFSGDPKYEYYKKNTPVFWPLGSGFS
ncbi:DUF1295-domain-containing protein [Abortiporus biennis]|nr:DUF1295-domain-containing protein [Abortiporus biennis]